MPKVKKNGKTIHLPYTKAGKEMAKKMGDKPKMPKVRMK